MKLKIVASNAFKKALKSAKKRGLKLDKLQSIVDKLADEIPLEQKGCNKNVVKLFLLQPFCYFLMFRLYMCSCKLEQACSICKSIISMYSRKLVQACSIFKSIIYKHSHKLVQACSNFKEPYIQRFISLKTIYPM